MNKIRRNEFLKANLRAWPTSFNSVMKFSLNGKLFHPAGERLNYIIEFLFGGSTMQSAKRTDLNNASDLRNSALINRRGTMSCFFKQT